MAEASTLPDCYTVGLGDYSTFARTHARKWLKAYTDDDTSWRELDSMVREKAIRFHRKYLSRLEPRCIGLSEGNHYHQFLSGATDTQFLCELAKLPYLDKPAFIRLRIGYGGRTLAVLKVLCHHGDWSGGAGKMGSDVNSLENRVAGFSHFDIVIAGHTHRKYGVKLPELDIPDRGQLTIIDRPRVLIRCGCFITGYDEKCLGRHYAQDKLMRPTEIGYVKLEIRFKRHYNPHRYAEHRRFAKRSTREAAGRSFENWRPEFTVIY